MTDEVPRVVVTGASGFLGTAVVRALVATGAQVVAVARRAGPGRVQVEDYADSPSGDVLIHLAEESSRARAADMGDVYERLAGETLAALLSVPWTRVVYASSALLYGDGDARPRRPTDSVHVDDVYTRVKHRGEQAVLGSGRGVVARLANVYGPGMAPGNVVSTILSQLDQRGPISVRDPEPVRDYLWIEDAARGLATLATADVTRPCDLWNIGSGTGCSVGELANMMCVLAERGDRTVVATRPTRRRSCLVLDISATRDTWGWAPGVDLVAGLGRLVDARRKSAERCHG